MNNRFSALVREGEDALAKKDFKTAQRLFGEAMTIRASFPPLIARHAESALLGGDEESAWESLRRLLLLVPDNKLAKIKFAKLSASLKKPDAKELTKGLLSDAFSNLTGRLARKLNLGQNNKTEPPDTSWLDLDGLNEEQLKLVEEACRCYDRQDLEGMSNPVDILYDQIPEHPATLKLVGRYFQHKRAILKAIETVEKLVEISPESLPPKYELVRVYAFADRLEDAKNLMKTVEPEDPHDPDYLHAQIAIKRSSGENEEAIKLLLELEKGNIKPSFSAELLARLYLWGGQFDKVTEWAEVLSERAPHSGTPFMITASARQLHPGTPLFEKALLAAKNPSFSREERSKVEFALAKALTSAKEHDTAFEHFVKGNMLADRIYDPVQEQDVVDKRIAAFTPQIMARATDNDRGKGIVFVCGMPRSGSTLVAQILGSHPDAISIGESQIFHSCLRKAEDAGYPDALAEFSDEFLAELGQTYLDLLPPKTENYKFVIDKELLKFMNLGLFKLILPGAKFVHTKRNPFDTCFSIFCQQFGGAHPFAYRQDTLAHFYHLHDEIMAHWYRIMPDAIFPVQYEGMVHDTEPMIRALLDAVGMEFHPDCLNFDQSATQVTTSSAYQVRQKIYSSSINAWERHREGLKELIEGLEHKPFT